MSKRQGSTNPNNQSQNSASQQQNSSQQQSQQQQQQQQQQQKQGDEQKNYTVPSEQIGHKIIVRVKEAKLDLDEEKVTKKTYFKPGLEPFDREMEEKQDRQKRIIHKKVDFLTYATLYFGTNINTKQEQKLFIKQLVQKKIDKELQERQKLDWDKSRLKMYESIKSKEQSMKSKILNELDETNNNNNTQNNLNDSKLDSSRNPNVTQNSNANKGSNQNSSNVNKSSVNNTGKGDALNNSVNQSVNGGNKSSHQSKNQQSEQQGQEQEQEQEQEKRLGLSELKKATLQEVGVINLKNMTKIQNSKIQKGIAPVFDQTFEFQRGTENFFTIALWQRDSDEQQYYKQRLQFLQERYQGDNLIGEARIDFSTFFQKPKEANEQTKNTFTRQFDLKLGKDRVGTIEIECTYVPPSKIPEKRIVSDELGLMINSVDINLTTSNKEWEKFKDLVPKLAVRIQSRTKYTTSVVPLAKAMSFKEVISFKKIPPDAVKIYFEIICTNPISDLQKCAGVSFVDIDDLEELDNLDRMMKKKTFEQQSTEAQKKEAKERFDKLKKKIESLEIKYKGTNCGTLKFDYILIPRVEPKQFKLTEFKDMKELSKPDKFERQKQKHLQMRHKLMKQKLWKEIEPVKDSNDTKPEPIELQYNVKTKQLMSSSSAIIPIRQTDKIYKEKHPNPTQNSPDKTQADPKFVKPVKVYANVKEIIKIHLPKINTTTPTGALKAQKTITPNIFVKVLKDQNYNHSVYGNGLSLQQSASTLRYSVPDFSLPKGARFDNPDNKVPGPNAYQKDGIGMLDSTLETDLKLKQRREKLFQYEQKKQGKSPPKKPAQQNSTNPDNYNKPTNPTNTNNNNNTTNANNRNNTSTSNRNPSQPSGTGGNRAPSQK